METSTIEQPSLFTDMAELETRVRSNDDDTSWRAARISRADNESLKDTLYRLLANHGPQTDDSLFELYESEGGRRTTQRVRTARAEMSRERNPRTGFEETPRVR